MPIDEVSLGLAAGAVAALVVAVAALVTRRSGRSWPVPVGGVALVVAGLWAIARVRSLPVGVAVAVVGVGVAGGLPIARRSLVVGTVVAAPFAVYLGVDASGTAWIRAAVVAGASVGAALVADTDGRPRWSDLTPALYLVSVVGVFAAVPDTEEVAALLGVAAAIAALGWPIGMASLGRIGAASATALLVWVVAVGGRGRPPSIVGGLACLGLLTAVPVGEWLSRRWSHRPRRRRWAIAGLLVHGTAVLVASRGAGIRADMRVAVLLSVAATAIAVAGAVVLASPSGRLVAGAHRSRRSAVGFSLSCRHVRRRGPERRGGPRPSSCR